MHRIFISYPSSRQSQAMKIVGTVESHDLSCWIAPRNIPAGSDYIQEISKAIDGCSDFILLLSEDAQDSVWIRKELQRAVDKKKHIIPLLLEPVTLNPAFGFLLGDIQIKDYYRRRTRILLEVVSSIHERIRQQRTPDAALSFSRAEAACREGNYQEAARHYRDAAMRGHTKAQYRLGLLYASGTGVPEIPSQAFTWFLRAARLGDADAQYELAACYDEGLGTQPSITEAAAWYRRAAEQGHAAAQYCLALCLEAGDGVPKDPAQAEKWFREAALQGDGDAAAHLSLAAPAA